MSNRRLEDDPEPFEDLPPEDDRRYGRDEGRWSDVRSSAQDAVRRANSGRQQASRNGLSNLTNRPGLLVAALVAGLLVLGMVTYNLTSKPTEPETQVATPARPAASPAASPAAQPATQPAAQPAEPDTGIGGIFQSQPTETTAQTRTESWPSTIARVLLRLSLAALLSALLAFRPRKDLPGIQRNPYVSQTQILLAVVASALMMIVADNAARAFGIFAAASLVRFRTNVRDPKETTVLLVALAIGLGTGVGRWELALVLALFVMLMLWVLEYYEPAQISRALELTIKTRNVEETDEILKEIFEKHNFMAEIREMNRQDEKDPLGKIVYAVSVTPTVSTDQLSEEIFEYDPANIDSIIWDQKKSTSYNYR